MLSMSACSDEMMALEFVHEDLGCESCWVYQEDVASMRGDRN